MKFQREDAEAVMATALEGGSVSEKEEPLFLEIAISAPLETPGEGMKIDGGERKPSERKLQVRSRKFSLRLRRHLRR